MEKVLLWRRPEFSHSLITIQFTPTGIDGKEPHAHIFLVCRLSKPVERCFIVAQPNIS
jgi:hypothetical protein